MRSQDLLFTVYHSDALQRDTHVYHMSIGTSRG